MLTFSYFKRIRPFVSVLIVLTFCTSLVFPIRQVSAQTPLNLPIPGTMITPTSVFNPTIIKGIKVFPENPLRFDFIVDQGDSGLDVGANPRIRQNNKGENMVSPLHKESTKLIKYFLAALTTPEEDMWVNLSPYEKDRIIPESFGQTEMGRDLLAQDYILKQLTASLMYPEEELGNKFWKEIYKQAYEKFGTTEIPVNTFNKVWIMPSKAIVYENDETNTAYVVESRLKVMLEEDYLAVEKNSIKNNSVGTGLDPVRNDNTINAGGVKPLPYNSHNNFQTNIIRQIIIPAIEKEVNEGKHFAQLRQIYNSMILATWYKRNLKESLLNQIYIDKNKTAGVDIKDKNEKQKIYDQYLKAFKKGVYNYIKEDLDPVTQEIIPRKYFSGGAKLFIPNIISASPMQAIAISSSPILFHETVELKVSQPTKLASSTLVQELSLRKPDGSMPQKIDTFNQSIIQRQKEHRGIIGEIKTPYPSISSYTIDVIVWDDGLGDDIKEYSNGDIAILDSNKKIILYFKEKKNGYFTSIFSSLTKNEFISIVPKKNISEEMSEVIFFLNLRGAIPAEFDQRTNEYINRNYDPNYKFDLENMSFEVVKENSTVQATEIKMFDEKNNITLTSDCVSSCTAISIKTKKDDQIYYGLAHILVPMLYANVPLIEHIEYIHSKLLKESFEPNTTYMVDYRDSTYQNFSGDQIELIEKSTTLKGVTVGFNIRSFNNNTRNSSVLLSKEGISIKMLPSGKERKIGWADPDMIVIGSSPLKEIFSVDDVFNISLEQGSSFEFFKVKDLPIYHIEFEKKNLQTETLRRLAIFVEDNLYYGKILSQSELETIDEHRGIADGYDFSIDDIVEFLNMIEEKDIDDFNAPEKKLKNALIENGFIKFQNNKYTKIKNIAIISTAQDIDANKRKRIIRHEFDHGIWFVNQNKREQVQSIFNNLKKDHQDIVYWVLKKLSFDTTNKDLVLREFSALFRDVRNNLFVSYPWLTNSLKYRIAIMDISSLLKINDSKTTKGGINLNPTNLNLQTQGQGINFNVPIDPTLLETLTSSPIDGFTPVILQIVPVTNLNLFLGLKNSNHEESIPKKDILSQRSMLYRHEDPVET